MANTIKLMFSESWRGQRPLYKVFWLYYVLGTFIAVFLLLLFLQVADLFPGLIAVSLILAAVAALLIWKAWALVSIWRCASTSTSTYKFLARAYIVCFLLIIPYSSVDKFREYRLRGYDAVTKSQIRNAAVAEEAFFAKTLRYTETARDLHEHGLEENPNIRLVIIPGKEGLDKSIVIVGRHIQSEKPFFFDSTTGEITETTLKDVRDAGVAGIDP